MSNEINAATISSPFIGFARELVESVQDLVETVRSIPASVRDFPESSRNIPWGRVTLAVLAAAGLIILATAVVFVAMIALMMSTM
jgi:hypothetical protein